MKILITEPEGYSSEALEIYKSIGQLELLSSFNQLDTQILDTDVLVVKLGLQLNAQLLVKAPHLKYILSPTTGLDHIDLNLAKERGIHIISLKGEQDFLGSIPSTAEHSFALLMATIRNIPKAYNDVLEGKWNRKAFIGHNLSNMSLGILGLGRVGNQVATYARAFGMKVSAFDPSNKYFKDWIHRAESPEQLFSENKVLSLHIPYDEDNHHFVNKDLLSCLPHDSILINTSRGGVWDEATVASFMKGGRIKALATDVLYMEHSEELRAQNPLIGLANEGYPIIITPHISGATFESMARTEVFIANKFSNYLASLA